jgi:hypothetical protein
MKPAPAPSSLARLFLVGGLFASTVATLSATFLALTETPAQAREAIARNTAVLRWLDKGSARVRTVEVPVNQTVTIQTLQVIVRACQQTPPEEPPESAAYVDVWEVKAGQPTEEVYRGWLFASSPALSALEHPVYDLWVLDCKDVGTGPVEATPPAPAGDPTHTPPHPKTSG